MIDDGGASFEVIISSRRFCVNNGGFKGYVVSDSEAVEFLTPNIVSPPTEEEMAAQVVNAGLNIRTILYSATSFILPLRRAINEGKVSLHTLDQRR